MDIDGVWEGVYIDAQYEVPEVPIRARFDVAGRRLSGTMFDERTRTESCVQEAIDSFDDDPHEKAVWQDFADEFPDAICSSTLPENSRIKGVIKGMSVRFTKEYLGDETRVWEANGLDPAPESNPCDPVVYEGEVSDDGNRIEGTWTIHTPKFWGLMRTPLVQGDFWLERQDPKTQSETAYGLRSQ
jgi:hypothetical protein